MSGTLQLPNTSKTIIRVFDFSYDRCIFDTCYGYEQKIGGITPSLCVQQDVLYPNAFDAICEPFDQASLPGASGCKGHQIGRSFPLEPVLPMAIPLVQYPSPTQKIFPEHFDMCARPVLNWQDYILRTKNSLAFNLGLVFGPIGGKNPKPLFKLKRNLRTTESKNENKENTTVMAATNAKEKPEKDEGEEFWETEDEEEIDMEVISEEPKTSVDFKPSVSKPPSEELIIKRGERFRISRVPQKKDTETDLKDLQPEIPDGFNGKCSFGRKPMVDSSGRKVKLPTREELTSSLFPDSVKLDETREEARIRRKEARLLATKGEKQKSKKFSLPFVPGYVNRSKIRPEALKKFKSQPRWKVEGTWNHLFGGMNGALHVSADSASNCLNVYLGAGRKLRMVTLEPSSPASIVSYKVGSVWEEDVEKVPSNIRGNEFDPLADVILQIVPSPSIDMVGVRRGKSIELYTTDLIPELYTSVPNICYGQRDYFGWRSYSRGKMPSKNPFLLSLDFHPYNGAELMTMDENFIIRWANLRKEVTVGESRINGARRKICDRFPQYPSFSLNNAAGAIYGSNGETHYAWADSYVHYGDRRELSIRRADYMTIFDLRRSIPSLAMADQRYFGTYSNFHLNEFISCVQRSKRDNYYWVATSSRIFLMDVRVPHNPVLKMSHGLRSAPPYLHTHYDQNFETIVAASQRMTETFCAITDCSHIHCFDRSGCTAANPVLSCPPRHLSNSREFFDQVIRAGYNFPSESEHQCAQDHCYAWTTGVSIYPNTNASYIKCGREPPGYLVFTCNNYGNLFYQEWLQKPIDNHRKYKIEDYKMTEFLTSWRSAMRIDSIEHLHKPCTNPYQLIDCSIFTRTAQLQVAKRKEIRTKSFNPCEPDLYTFHEMREMLPPLKHQLETMKHYQGDRVPGFLKVWEDAANNPEVEIKEEVFPVDDYNYYNDGDVEILDNPETASRPNVQDISDSSSDDDSYQPPEPITKEKSESPSSDLEAYISMPEQNDESTGPDDPSDSEDSEIEVFLGKLRSTGLSKDAETPIPQHSNEQDLQDDEEYYECVENEPTPVSEPIELFEPSQVSPEEPQKTVKAEEPMEQLEIFPTSILPDENPPIGSQQIWSGSLFGDLSIPIATQQETFQDPFVSTEQETSFMYDLVPASTSSQAEEPKPSTSQQALRRTQTSKRKGGF